MKWVVLCFALYLVYLNTNVAGVTDLQLVDSIISDVYSHPSHDKKQKLMDNIHLYLITLRRFNTMTKKGCFETKEQALELVHSGGPHFLNLNAFYSDEEQILRYKMNFTDFEFQEYQYYRLDTENEWSELKEQISQLDAGKNVTFRGR